MYPSEKNKNNLRVIKTARSMIRINLAVLFGYKPIVKAVEPDENRESKFTIYKNKKTGYFSKLTGDYRFGHRIDKDEYEQVVYWTFYSSPRHRRPYAAYLIPKDIKIGERVFVKDLIENFVGQTWNQGNSWRLKSCEAIWNGKELEIQFDPKKDVVRMYG